MNRHVGASFTLSVLVVVFFAVVLYEPEHARHPRPSRGKAPAAPRPIASNPPLPTPGVPLTEAATAADLGPVPEPVASASEAPHMLPVASPALGPAPRVAASRSRPYAAAPERPATIQVASNRRVLAPPRRSAFTQVADGESLADVAARIYGTPDAVGQLWRANRDIIDRSDAALRAGTLLRTP